MLHQSVLLSDRSCLLALSGVHTRVVTLIIKLIGEVSGRDHIARVDAPTDLQIFSFLDCFLEHFERVLSIHGWSEKFRFDRIDLIAQIFPKV